MAIPSQEIGYGTEEKLLWQISKQIQNLIGVTYNSGSGFSTTYVPYTGATSNVNLGSYNISANSFINGFSSITASGTQVVLTVNSAPEILVSGSGGQTIKLPDATTLANGTTFSFNNNQSSGAISVNNNSNTLVLSIPSGGYAEIMLLSNSTAAGSWDKHFQAPSNVSWSTNTLDYPGSITSATWNGTVVAPNRGGTGQSTYTDGQLLIGNTTGNTLSKSTLTPGTGISIVNGNGSITITATGAVSGAVTGSGTTNYVPKFTSASVIGNSNIQDSGTLITLGSNVAINGFLTGASTKVLPAGNNFAGQDFNLTSSANGANLINQNNWNLNSDSFNYTGYTIYDNRIILNKSVTGTNPTILYQGVIYNNGTATQSAYTFYSNNKGTGTYSNYTHFQAGDIFGQASTTATYTSYKGFSVNFPVNNLTDGTGLLVGNILGSGNSRALDLNVSVGSNKWNIYAQGTADNYMAGSLGIGTTSLTGYVVNIAKNITGATTSYGINQAGTVQSDVTTAVYGYFNQLNTQAASFTLGGYSHYIATQGTIGSGSVITEQNGFYVASTLTGATNNFGFRGMINGSGGRYNLFMDGTANNYMAGGLGIGTTSIGNFNGNLAVGSNITGNINSRGIHQFGTTQSDVTTSASGYMNTLNTQATTFTLGEYRHYFASQGTIGSGSTITTQYGFQVSSNLIGATNNYGFYSNIPIATNNWNIYMNGTAKNYLNGSLLIGSTTDAGYKLDVTGTTRIVYSDNSFANGLFINNTNTGTSAFCGINFTTNSVFGGSINYKPSNYSVTNQSSSMAIDSIGNNKIGITANANYTGVAQDIYFLTFGSNSTYQMLIKGSGNVLINSNTEDASAQLKIDSTTKGVLFPRMTTTQKNAISSPATGLVVFDTTLGKLCVFSTTWQTITSS